MFKSVVLSDAYYACWRWGRLPPQRLCPLDKVEARERRFGVLTYELNVHVDVVLKFFTDDSFEVDHHSVFEFDVLHGAHVPQVVRIVPVADCVAKPLDALLAVAAIDNKHFVPDVHLCETITLIAPLHLR